MPNKIRKLKKSLLKAGFTCRLCKGSYTVWLHKLLPEMPLTISGKDGDDAKTYLEKEVQQRLKKLEDLQ